MKVNENRQAFITVRPVDRNGVLYTPTTARYRLDDHKTKQAIIAWTSIVTMSTSMLITIPATSNTILNDSNAREKKVVTVETDFGTATANTEDYEYWLQNLRFVS